MRADTARFAVCLAGRAPRVRRLRRGGSRLRRVGGALDALDLDGRTRVAVGFGAFVAGSSAGTLGVDYWALQRAGDGQPSGPPTPRAQHARVGRARARRDGRVALRDHGRGPRAQRDRHRVLLAVPLAVAGALWFTAARRVDRFTALPAGGHGRRLGRCASLRRRDRRRRPRAARDLQTAALPARARRLPRLLGRRHAASARRSGGSRTSGSPARARVHDGVRRGVVAAAGGGGRGGGRLAWSLDAVGLRSRRRCSPTLVYRFFTLWLPIAVAAVALTQVKRARRGAAARGARPGPG